MDAVYAEFLDAKAVEAKALGIEPGPMPAHLYDFQEEATRFCLRQGRAALFLDTGLGKTVCELEFARQAAAASGGTALILAPLAVGRQIEREGQRFGYDVRVVRDGGDVAPGINICNYDRLDKLRPEVFGCVALDESSILKSFTGATTRALIEAFRDTPFRLAATATPAPNDHMELGQHAAFLGVMPSNEMLARWFISDQTHMGRYRLKGHAVTSFWDWLSSWAVMAETPADMGFDGSRFVLPPLRVERHQVIGDVRAPAGELFAGDVSATHMHEVKRQTAEARAAAVAALVAAEPDEAWLIWCDTNYEADALRAAIPAAEDVRGSQTPEQKEAGLLGFALGAVRYLITKPSIGGFGMNWQNCARIVFVGRTFSYESWYQAVRRCWRFGQTREVVVHLIVADGEEQIGRVIERKGADHDAMKSAMRAAARRRMGAASSVKVSYDPQHKGRVPEWLFAA